MKKVMCFGTFDKLHKGHLSFLKQARKKGDYLIAVIARDKNVIKIKKNKPFDNERKRLKKIINSGLAEKAVLGNLKDKYKVIKKEEPDIICLGYDQEANKEEIKKIFKGRIIRMKPYKENIYKSSLLGGSPLLL
jgi:cytidyltransferase-like protein